MGCKEIMVVEGSEYLPIHIGALSELMFSCGPQGWGSWGKSCKIMEKKFIVILRGIVCHLSKLLGYEN
jgi:hypothetical protein